MAKAKQKIEWMSVAEYSEATGQSERTVRWRCTAGTIGKRVGEFHVIAKAEATAWLTGTPIPPAKAKQIAETTLYSLTEAAEMLKVNQRWLRAQCAAGKLGTQVGKNWVFYYDELSKQGDKLAARKGIRSTAKLTPPQVIEIRKSTRTPAELAKQYKVDTSTIHRIRSGETYGGIKAARNNDQPKGRTKNGVRMETRSRATQADAGRPNAKRKRGDQS